MFHSQPKPLIRLFPAIVYQCNLLLEEVAKYPERAIFIAIENNNLTLLRRMIENNIKVLKLQPRNLNPVQWAAQCGNLEALKIMYEATPEIFLENPDLASIAVRYNHLPVLEYIFDKDISQFNFITKSDSYSVTTIIYHNKWQNFFERLLQHENLMINKSFIMYLKKIGDLAFLNRLTLKFPQHATIFEVPMAYRLLVEIRDGHTEIVRQIILENPQIIFEYLHRGSRLYPHLYNVDITTARDNELSLDFGQAETVVEFMAVSGLGNILLEVVEKYPNLLDPRVEEYEDVDPKRQIRTTSFLSIQWVRCGGDLRIFAELLKRYPVIATHYKEDTSRYGFNSTILLLLIRENADLDLIKTIIQLNLNSLDQNLIEHSLYYNREDILGWLLDLHPSLFSQTDVCEKILSRAIYENWIHVKQALLSIHSSLKPYEGSVMRSTLNSKGRGQPVVTTVSEVSEKCILITDQSTQYSEYNLFEAAEKGDIALISKIVLQNFEWLNKKDRFGRAIIHVTGEVSKEDVLERLKKLAFQIFNYFSDFYKCNFFPSHADGSDYSLHFAAHQGLGEVVKNILKNRPDGLELRDECSRFPVLLAAGNGHAELVEWMFRQNPIVLHQYDEGYHSTAATYAAEKGQCDVLATIIHLDASTLKQRDKKGMSAADYLVQLDPRFSDRPIYWGRNRLAVFRRILQEQPDLVRDCDNDGKTIAHKIRGNRIALAMILNNDPDALTRRDNQERTPIEYINMDIGLLEYLEMMKVCLAFRNKNNLQYIRKAIKGNLVHEDMVPSISEVQLSLHNAKTNFECTHAYKCRLDLIGSEINKIVNHIGEDIVVELGMSIELSFLRLKFAYYSKDEISTHFLFSSMLSGLLRADVYKHADIIREMITWLTNQVNADDNPIEKEFTYQLIRALYGLTPNNMVNTCVPSIFTEEVQAEVTNDSLIKIRLNHLLLNYESNRGFFRRYCPGIPSKTRTIRDLENLLTSGVEVTKEAILHILKSRDQRSTLSRSSRIANACAFFQDKAAVIPENKSATDRVIEGLKMAFDEGEFQARI